MEWSVFLTALDEAIRDYEERTFADYIDGGYDMYAIDEEDAYDE